jgi:hypothetical protein
MFIMTFCWQLQTRQTFFSFTVSIDNLRRKLHDSVTTAVTAIAGLYHMDVWLVQVGEDLWRVMSKLVTIQCH